MSEGSAPREVGMMLAEVIGASMAFVAQAAECDFVIVDAEHGPFPVEAAADLCVAGKASGLKVLVRVPDAGRSGITKALDMGATGIVVPMVSSAAIAHDVVRNSMYAPLGARGVSTTRTHSRYKPGRLAEYMSEANSRVEIWLQVENLSGLSAASEIASVPGVTGLLLGPNDLLQDLGAPGENDHERLARAIRDVAVEARGANVRAGIASSSNGILERAVESGYDLLCAGSEIGMIINGFRTKIASI